MKALFIVLIVLCYYLPIHSRGADPWSEEPILSALSLDVVSAMGEYELWADDWRKSKRGLTDLDCSINLLVETTFIPVQLALEAHPNPMLLDRCLLFLGTAVPPEFEYLWRARILEMAYLDKTTSKKVNEMLKAKKLPSLEERALR